MYCLSMPIFTCMAVEQCPVPNVSLSFVLARLSEVFPCMSSLTFSHRIFHRGVFVHSKILLGKVNAFDDSPSTPKHPGWMDTDIP